MAKGHGGVRPNSGRKNKPQEDHIKKLSLDAMVEVYGSPEKCLVHAAKLSKDSFHHLKLLLEYAFGKPKDSLDITTDGESINLTEDDKLKRIAELKKKLSE